MFSEVLRIKPVLDPATSASMERNLSGRFKRVSKRFSAGMKSALKGAIFGLSLGLLSKLLNPINDLEEKIKKLLGDSDDISDVADKFNTTPGKLKRLESLAGGLGVEPEQLREMLGKFQTAVEEANKPLKPGDERSGAAVAVKEFAGEKDIAEGFFAFLQSLKAAGVTNPKARAQAEKEVFGERQFGGARRLIESDPAVAFGKVGNPSTEKLNTAITKLGDNALLQKQLSIKHGNQDLIASSNILTPELIQAMERLEATRAAKQQEQLKGFQDMARAADGIEELKVPLQDLSNAATKQLGALGRLLEWGKKIELSKPFRHNGKNMFDYGSGKE